MASNRGRQTVTDLVWSMAVVGAAVAALFLLAWWQRPEGLGEDVRAPVDVAGVVGAVRISEPFPVLEPVDLPAGWTATSAWFEPDDEATDAAFLHLGYTTPADSYAEVRQTDAAAADVIPEWTDDGEPTGETVRVADLGWRRLVAPESGNRSLVARRVAGGTTVTLVVTGKADWPELEELAASLR